jgi:hypothetical protein
LALAAARDLELEDLRQIALGGELEAVQPRRDLRVGQGRRAERRAVEQ